MKAAACLWAVHGLEQRVAVIICAIRCLHLQLSCKWGEKRRSCCTWALPVTCSWGFGKWFFLLRLKRIFNLLYKAVSLWARSGCVRGVVAPEPPSSLHPAALLHRIWCCSCSQLCCAAPHPKMFAPIIFAEVTACSNVAELWPHNTSCVTTDFLFPVNIKISWAERIVLFLFSLMFVGFFYMFTLEELYYPQPSLTSSGWLTVEGAGRLKAEPRAMSELVCVMSLHLVEVMALKGIAGHLVSLDLCKHLLGCR